MSDAVKLVLSLSISGSALALLLFAVKRAARDRLPKAFQYYVWLVVLMRLALPISFDRSVTESLMSALPGAVHGGQSSGAALNLPLSGTIRLERPILVQPGEVFSFNDGLLPREEAALSSLQTLDCGLLVWMAGFLIAFGIKASGYARFSLCLKKAHRDARPEEEQLLKRLYGGNMTIVRNPLARTPMLHGFLRPVIVLPDKAYTLEQLRLVLLHELTHYRRLDVPLKWLSLFVCSAHWFNPLAYFIHREIDRACELSCDEAVIKALNTQEKQAYGDTLISAVAPRRLIGAFTPMCKDIYALKERLIAIMNYRSKSNATKAISIAMLMLAVTIAAALGACVPPSKEETAKLQPESDASYTVRLTPKSEAPDLFAVQPTPDDVTTYSVKVQSTPDNVVTYMIMAEHTPENETPHTFTVEPTSESEALYIFTVEPTSDSETPFKDAVQPKLDSLVSYTATVSPTQGSADQTGKAEKSSEPEVYRFMLDDPIYITAEVGSDDVRALQTRLNVLAAAHPAIPVIEVNGTYDADTKAAVVEAQRVFGLEEDGVFGPDTWFALAPFDGAAVFAHESGEVRAVKLASIPGFEEVETAAAKESARGAWIIIAPERDISAK